MISQFQNRRMYRWDSRNLVMGLALFIIGLVKKVIFADGVVVYVSPIFDAAKNGIGIGWADAWLGALAYTVQLYFDFSGYSDMAIGLSLLFGVKLPINFDSPYQSVNITDFWRRWHISLSNFLRDYLYIPLGGNRQGQFRRYLNLLMTMLLGGLWHGAGWTFILWGGLHGMYLVINHAWRWLRRSLGQDLTRSTWWGNLAGRAITFIVVVAAWVLFRAENLAGATPILSSMFKLPITSKDLSFIITQSPIEASVWVLVLLLISWLCPNSQYLINKLKHLVNSIELFDRHPERIHPSLRHRLQVLPQWLQIDRIWHYLLIGAALPVIFLLVAVSESQAIKEFIYFNF